MPGAAPRYKSHSDRNLLICNGFMFCFFSRQSVQSLDFQGFGKGGCKLHTKLSTISVNARQTDYESST